MFGSNVETSFSSKIICATKIMDIGVVVKDVFIDQPTGATAELESDIGPGLCCYLAGGEC